MDCENCGQPIPRGRLEALPNTTTCVKCSMVKKKVAVTIWDDKTPDVLIVEADQAARFKELEYMDGRHNRL